MTGDSHTAFIPKALHPRSLAHLLHPYCQWHCSTIIAEDNYSWKDAMQRRRSFWVRLVRVADLLAMCMPPRSAGTTTRSSTMARRKVVLGDGPTTRSATATRR